MTQIDEKATGEDFASMDEKVFCARFVTHMLKYAGFANFKDGSSLSAYAEDIAPTYWADEQQRADGPEECAEVDISYWEC